MKLRIVAYSMYMVFSLLLSITIASIPPVFLFLILFHKIDSLLTGWSSFFGFVPAFIEQLSGALLPPFVFERFWFIVLIAPILMFCYGLFIGLLIAMFKISRRGLPCLEDGFYPMETQEWLLYEYYQVFYNIFPYFAWFFSIFMDTKPRHTLFGAKIGKNTVIGNGRLFNPERTTVGNDCFFGYDAIVSGHVYEGKGLYLKVVEIGNNVIVGANAVVLPGVKIGDNVIIASNTTVPKDKEIPPNSIWVHNRVIPRKDKPVKINMDEKESENFEKPDS